MEGRVEAGDLRERRSGGAHRRNRVQAKTVVQRGELAQLVDRGEPCGVDERRRDETCAGMYEAVTARGEVARADPALVQGAEDPGERRGVPGTRGQRLGRLRKNEAWLSADALDLAVVATLAPGEQGELERRGARVQNENVPFAGGCHAGVCGRMSSLRMPATATGFFIASRRNGSPSSWFRITSMKVVTLSACAAHAVLSAAVSSVGVRTVTPR